MWSWWLVEAGGGGVIEARAEAWWSKSNGHGGSAEEAHHGSRTKEALAVDAVLAMVARRGGLAEDEARLVVH
ncbi:hypothetical protein VNO80_03092 [Phaseolus coccineus]|uniref:Uncharacterized protein n=1 Tax=Phaseolus coccineus TaxID=3886 RepID=A0AAN9NY15_PHACN